MQLAQRLTQLGLAREQVGLGREVAAQPPGLLLVQGRGARLLVPGLTHGHLLADADLLGALAVRLFLALGLGGLLGALPAILVGSGLLVGRKAQHPGVDAREFGLDRAQADPCLEGRGGAAGLLHGPGVGRIVVGPGGDLATLGGQRNLGLVVRDAGDDHPLKVLEVGATQEHAAHDLLDVGQVVAGADARIVGRQGTLALPTLTAAGAPLDDGAVLAHGGDRLAVDHALELEVPTQVRGREDVAAVRQQEQVGTVGRAHEAVASLPALLGHVQNHQAAVLATLVLEADVGGQPRQVIAVEVEPVGLGADDAGGALAIKDRHELEQGRLTAAVAPRQHGATRDRELHHPAGAVGVDEDQAQQTEIHHLTGHGLTR